MLRKVPSVPTIHTPEGRRFLRRINSLCLDDSPKSEDDVFLQECKQRAPRSSSAGRIRLRSGKTYLREFRQASNRENSTGKQSPSQQLILDNKKCTLNNKLSRNKSKTMALDYNKVNQLINLNIPVYSGENSDINNDLEIFIKCCEKVYECLVGDQEIELFLRLIPTKLRGRAFSVLCGETFQNFSELKNLLNDKFSENKPYRVLVDELRLIHQIPGETVSSFGSRIFRSYQVCKKRAEGGPRNCEALLFDLEEVAINTFLGGLLDPNLRLYFLRDNETSLRRILDKAEKIEVREKQLYLQNYHPVLSSFSQQCNINSSQFNDNALSNFSGNNTSYFQPNFNSTTFPNHPNQISTAQPIKTEMPNISFSGQKHSFSDQPLFSLPTGNNASTNFQRPNVIKKEFVNKIQCNFCNRMGHSYSQCRTRKNSPFCSNCRVYGHTVQNCASARRSVSQQVHSFNKNHSQKSDTDKRCEFCKRANHKVQDCRAKQEWELKTSNLNSNTSEN